MSIFTRALKTFTTDITGEEIDLKINNAVWIILKNKYKLTQQQYLESGEEEHVITSCKFIASVFEANGYKVTEKDVYENTDEIDIMRFNLAYNTMLGEKAKDYREEDGLEREPEGDPKK